MQGREGEERGGFGWVAVGKHFHQNAFLSMVTARVTFEHRRHGGGGAWSEHPRKMAGESVCNTRMVGQDVNGGDVERLEKRKLGGHRVEPGAPRSEAPGCLERRHGVA